MDLLHLLPADVGHALGQPLRWAASALHGALHTAWQALAARQAPGATPLRGSTLLVVFDAAAPAALSPEQAWSAALQPQTTAVVLRPARDPHAALAWLARLRQARPGEPPAVVLLPVHDPALHLAALRSGADAVLPPDASPALIEAQLARLRRASGAVIHGPGGLQLDADSRTARIGACLLPLRPGPFRLLWTVAAEPERVFSLARLQDAVCSRPGAGSGLVHAYASRVRRALRPHGVAHCLQTVHGVGYRYCAEPAAGAVRDGGSETGQESATAASRSGFGMPVSPASFHRHDAIAPDA